MLLHDEDMVKNITDDIDTLLVFVSVSGVPLRVVPLIWTL